MGKVCKKCNIEQDLNSFYKDKKMVEGIKNICKLCDLERMKNYNKLNIKKLKEYSKKYNLENKDQKKEYGKKYRLKKGYDSGKTKIQNQLYKEKNPGKKLEYSRKNKEKQKILSKKHYLENREHHLNYNKEYNKKNKDKVNKYHNNYIKEKYRNDINFKLIHSLRGRINNVLKKQYIKKDNKSIKYVGCDLEKYKQHIQNQFLPMFTWKNHGIIWEIDHIQPCASFDFSIEENIYKCFNYTNLRPVFKTTDIAKQYGYNDIIGNRNKGAKILDL